MKIRLFVSVLALWLGACANPPAPTVIAFEPTATLRGAIVPTRATPLPTDTPMVTDTQTAPPTATPTASATITQTPEPTETATITETVTPTESPSPTSTVPETHTLTPTEARSLETQQIAYDETVSGEINNSNPVIEYHFAAQAGDSIQIDLVATSGNLDPLLKLLDANHREINRNDDVRNGVRDSRLNMPTLSPGTYTIVATRFGEENGTSSGAFELTLTLVSSATVLEETVLPGTRSIAYGDSVNGTISGANYEIRYTFEGNRGDAITIDMEAKGGSLDPYLILLDTQGQELATNDDRTAITRDSQITVSSLPATGTYMIVATRFNGETGSTSGSFELQLSSE